MEKGENGGLEGDRGMRCDGWCYSSKGFESFGLFYFFVEFLRNGKAGVYYRARLNHNNSCQPLLLIPVSQLVSTRVNGQDPCRTPNALHDYESKDCGRFLTSVRQSCRWPPCLRVIAVCSTKTHSRRADPFNSVTMPIHQSFQCRHTWFPPAAQHRRSSSPTSQRSLTVSRCRAPNLTFRWLPCSWVCRPPKSARWSPGSCAGPPSGGFQQRHL